MQMKFSLCFVTFDVSLGLTHSPWEFKSVRSFKLFFVSSTRARSGVSPIKLSNEVRFFLLGLSISTLEEEVPKLYMFSGASLVHEPNRTYQMSMNPSFF